MVNFPIHKSVVSTWRVNLPKVSHTIKIIENLALVHKKNASRRASTTTSIYGSVVDRLALLRGLQLLPTVQWNFPAGIFFSKFPGWKMITPWKIYISNPTMEVWKMILLFKWVIFRFQCEFSRAYLIRKAYYQCQVSQNNSSPQYSSIKYSNFSNPIPRDPITF